MIIETYEIIVLVVCFIGSAFYSGSEAVLLSIDPNRARQLIEEGGRKGRALKFMVENPNEVLTTILVGNNVVNIGAASLMTSIVSRVFQNDAVGISAGVTTLIILFFGEILPKTFARAKAESLVTPVITILQITYFALIPLIKTMTWLINKFLGSNAQIHGRLVTKNEIEFMVSKAEKEKTIDSKQLELLNSILEFPKIKVKDIMIPRKEIKYIQKKSTFPEIMEAIRRDAHSRYPVCDGELENALGFLHVKDLAFVRSKDRENFKIRNFLKEPFFVYEHMKIQSVFDHMKRKKIHLALVKDENGLIVGIVTLEDIIEEIFGEIQDEHDVEEHPEPETTSIHTTGIKVEGQISLRDLTDYDIKIPLNDNYSTLTGFLLDMLGNNFPEQGQLIFWEGFSFELVSVEESEIKEVIIKDVDGEKHLFSKKEAIESIIEDAEPPRPMNLENKDV